MRYLIYYEKYLSSLEGHVYISFNFLSAKLSRKTSCAFFITSNCPRRTLHELTHTPCNNDGTSALDLAGSEGLLAKVLNLLGDGETYMSLYRN